MMDDPLRVDQLAVHRDRKTILSNISFSLPRGKLVGLVGPNGAGKTTLLNASLGWTDSDGKVLFYGQPLDRVKQRVAYVPQRQSVDWDFPITVKELVLMGRYGKLGLFRRPREADVSAAEHFLRIVGMEEHQNQLIGQLSGGQQQRTFLARALLQEADLYLMDEPFAGVDLATETVMIHLLKQLRDQGKTILVVHHDLNSVERYFDWVILLNCRLIGCGPLEQVFTRENLNATYGKSYAIFDQALRLREEQERGLGGS